MKRLAVIVLAVLALASCSKVPRGVIGVEEMARLMADIHTGESMMEAQRREFMGDSMRKVLRQSIYARHGVSSEQVDSSFGWYGRNITYYMEVYDRTIEILEKRLVESGNRAAADAALSIAGDSVDVWAGPRFMRLSDRMPTTALVFDIDRDDNWQRGDSYTWRVKMFNNGHSRWQIAAEYADGTVEFIERNADGDGMKELLFPGDSTREATRIYGFLDAEPVAGTAVVFDSLALVRKRLDPSAYSRRYQVRHIRSVLPEVKIEHPADSAAAD